MGSGCLYLATRYNQSQRCYRVAIRGKQKSKVKRRKVYVKKSEAGGIFYEKVWILVSKMMASKAHGKNWFHLEDEALCRAWLDVSQDPIVGTNQKTEHLYEKVYEKYLEICKANGVGDHPELRAPSGIPKEQFM